VWRRTDAQPGPRSWTGHQHHRNPSAACALGWLHQNRSLACRRQGPRRTGYRVRVHQPVCRDDPDPDAVPAPILWPIRQLVQQAIRQDVPESSTGSHADPAVRTARAVVLARKPDFQRGPFQAGCGSMHRRSPPGSNQARGRMEMRWQNGPQRDSAGLSGTGFPGLGALTWPTRDSRTRGGRNAGFTLRGIEK
jgi:hypothetical protein